MTPEEIRKKAAEEDHGREAGEWYKFRKFCVDIGVVSHSYRWAVFSALDDEVIEKAYFRFQIEGEES